MPGSLVATWRRVPSFAQDLLLGFAVGLVWFAGTVYVQGNAGHFGEWSDAVRGEHGIAMWTTATVLALRRSIPPLALLAVVPVYTVVLGPPLVTEFHLLPILVVAYSVAQSGEVHPILVGLTGVLATLSLFRAGNLSYSQMLFSVFVVAGTTFLGALVREQRRSTATLAARNAELERLRAVESRQIVVEERTRIARELHDVVAHHVSAIVIRAQAAERLAGSRPEVATEAVGWIAEAGKEALTGMRHTVQVLRQSDGDHEVALAPQPTLADLHGIVGRLAPTGLEVDVRLPEPLPVLDPMVGLAAVRIAQEAVTNALRHADARRARVRVREESGHLLVTVDDDGSAGVGPLGARRGQGHGLRGMAERAASCGGRLDIVTGELGGWSVRATLPMRLAAGAP